MVAHIAAGASSDRLPELLGCCLAQRLQHFDDDNPVQLSVEVPGVPAPMCTLSVAKVRSSVILCPIVCPSIHPVASHSVSSWLLPSSCNDI